MPRANWGIDASDVDEFDRESQYKPYTGPLPVDGTYEWLIRVLKFIPATGEKNPQLRVGLELAPREGRDNEAQYEGYFKMVFLPVTSRTSFRYVPFLDAIGVSGRDFQERTITDEEGNIKKIGKWRNTGEEFILGELRRDDDDKKDGKTIGWMGPIEDAEDDEDEEFYEEDED